MNTCLLLIGVVVHGGLRKTISCKSARFGHSSSSGIIDFGINRKRVCYFQSFDVSVIVLHRLAL